MPAFLFSIATVSLVLSVPLLPFSTLSSLPLASLVLLSGYCALVISLTYILYYSILLTEAVKMLFRYFSVGILLTLAVQWLIFGSLSVPAFIPLLLVCIGAITIQHYYSYSVSIYEQ